MKYLIVLYVCFVNMIMALNLNKCYILAEQKYKIPTSLLQAIAKTETNNNPYAIVLNKNKTYDIGIMQINSSWLYKLNKVGITKNDLFNACNNIQIGAWILSQNIKKYGFNFKAIGAYNSSNNNQQITYAKKVLGNLKHV